MQKGRALVCLGVCVSLVAFAVVACSDDSDSKFADSVDSGAPDSSSPIFTADSGGDGSSSASCNPSLPDKFTPTWKAPTKSAACSAAQLSDYYDACLVSHAADAGDPCKTWTAANASCTACLEPSDGSGPIQQHHNRIYFTLNLAGCLAIERNEPNAGQCPAVLSAAQECETTACDGCFDTPSPSFGDFQNCQKAAKANTCTSFEGSISAACGAGLGTPDSGAAYACFSQPSDTQKSHFVRVEGIFCGQ